MTMEPQPETALGRPGDAIYITGLGSMSAQGYDYESVNLAYRERGTRIQVRELEHGPAAGAWLSREAEERLATYARENHRYRSLDRSVKLALYAARQATLNAGWQGMQRIGVLVGSSRGATGLFEQYHREYLASPEGKTASLTSPTTTLGNLATWVAQEIFSVGPTSELSSTCSTAIYAVGSAVAWLRAGMARRFLAGGTEAPLTSFTLAQMRALRIYARDLSSEYPCRPCATDAGRKNTMVLGEGACMLALERLSPEEVVRRVDLERSRRLGSTNVPPRGSLLARIAGVGFSVEPIVTGTSLSEEGHSLHRSMQDALRQARLDRVDLIVTHTPGTALGDRAELAAIRNLFGSDPPELTSNKWILGHTLGAAGALGIEYAIHLLRSLESVPYPYPVPFKQRPCRPQTVMVNSVGFGGNAGSIILARE